MPEKMEMTLRCELTVAEVAEAVKLYLRERYKIDAETVEFKVAEVGGDPLDRFPGTQQLVKAVATQKRSTPVPAP